MDILQGRPNLISASANLLKNNFNTFTMNKKSKYLKTIFYLSKIIFLYNYFEFFLSKLIVLPWIRIQGPGPDPDPNWAKSQNSMYLEP